MCVYVCEFIYTIWNKGNKLIPFRGQAGQVGAMGDGGQVIDIIGQPPLSASHFHHSVARTSDFFKRRPRPRFWDKTFWFLYFASNFRKTLDSSEETNMWLWQQVISTRHVKYLPKCGWPGGGVMAISTMLSSQHWETLDSLETPCTVP